jgi:hypothetical protein
MTKEKHGKSVEKTKKRKTEELMLRYRISPFYPFFILCFKTKIDAKLFFVILP